MSIQVVVDPTNPGQFFACCGLLELADRLWPGAEGSFAKGGREFLVTCQGTVRELLTYLIENPPAPVSRLELNGLEVAPIVAPLAFSFDGGVSVGLILDAWTQIRVEKGVGQVVSNPPWNFWSGQQTSMRIWTALQTQLTLQVPRLTDTQLEQIFEQRVFQKGRFGFDPGPAWNPLDVGFSPNEQSMEVESSPATELLAAIGLERFRPVMAQNRESFDYFTWCNAYSPAVAASAMAGMVRDRCSLHFRASIVSRGQYAALSSAFLLDKGDCDE